MYYLASNEWIHNIFHMSLTGKKSCKMSFMIKDDNVLDKYNKIWDKIKEKLNIKFHSMPIYDETYIKAKVREFDGVIK